MGMFIIPIPMAITTPIPTAITTPIPMAITTPIPMAITTIPMATKNPMAIKNPPLTQLIQKKKSTNQKTRIKNEPHISRIQVSPIPRRHVAIASPFDHCSASMDGIRGRSEPLPIMKHERRRDRERRAAPFFSPHENAPCLGVAARIHRQDRDSAGAPRQGLQYKRQGGRTTGKNKSPATGKKHHRRHA